MSTLKRMIADVFSDKLYIKNFKSGKNPAIRFNNDSLLQNGKLMLKE